MNKEQLKNIIKEKKIIKRLNHGTIIVEKGNPINFRSNDDGKTTNLIFDENGKPHGICVINGQKFKFEHGKFKK